ncbi:MAG: hypothetical protein M3179_11430 [Actinomycetota bacterium]|nr:hypothetical protein [Actinomycetota bacterium]
MPDDYMAELTRRMTEAMKPLQGLVDQMADTARSWVSGSGPPDPNSPQYGQSLRASADKLLELSRAWIEPVRRMSEEHLRYADEMAAWAQRHREFAEQMDEWAKAHRTMAQQLDQWAGPLLRFAEVISQTMDNVVHTVFPPGEEKPQV